MADRDAGSRGAEDEPRDPDGQALGDRHDSGPATAAPADSAAQPSSGDAGNAEQPADSTNAAAGTTPTAADSMSDLGLKPFTSPSGAPGPRPGGPGPAPTFAPPYGPATTPTHAPGPAPYGWTQGPGPARPPGPASGPGGMPASGPAVTPMYGQPAVVAGPAFGTYAYGPGGPGWAAPGWATTAGGAGAGSGSRPQSAAHGFGAFARGRGGQFIVAGLIGAILGGGAVAVGTAIWNQEHAYSAPFENGYLDGRGQRDRSFGGGQRMKDLQEQLSQLCQQTESGFRCAVPRSGRSE
ncbi:hypothetical protein [Microtetraspora malaysiensis]|uniref:Uncharacterized protein n=1 Tax=Microtetraspora malaysiensis TaxID=161358 RepID=A0ABW6SPG5_9ACTN